MTASTSRIVFWGGFWRGRGGARYQIFCSPRLASLSKLSSRPLPQFHSGNKVGAVWGEENPKISTLLQPLQPPPSDTA